MRKLRNLNKILILNSLIFLFEIRLGIFDTFMVHIFFKDVVMSGVRELIKKYFLLGMLALTYLDRTDITVIENTCNIIVYRMKNWVRNIISEKNFIFPSLFLKR